MHYFRKSSIQPQNIVDPECQESLQPDVNKIVFATSTVFFKTFLPILLKMNKNECKEVSFCNFVSYLYQDDIILSLKLEYIHTALSSVLTHLTKLDKYRIESIWQQFVSLVIICWDLQRRAPSRWRVKREERNFSLADNSRKGAFSLSMLYHEKIKNCTEIQGCLKMHNKQEVF